jgi:hypothetical protein
MFIAHESLQVAVAPIGAKCVLRLHSAPIGATGRDELADYKHLAPTGAKTRSLYVELTFKRRGKRDTDLFV